MEKESGKSEHSSVVLNIPINLLPSLPKALFGSNEDFFKYLNSIFAYISKCYFMSLFVDLR
jgi:hypothetical protein